MEHNAANRGGTATAPLINGQAQLTNMGLALRALVDCMDAGENSPRLGLFYGFSGYGKTVASAFAAAQTGAGYLCARSVWTEKTLLKAIAAELAISRPARTAAEMLDQIIEELGRSPRPLIIDEMDALVKRGSVEIIRDIHDATSSAILMIGEEALPAKLKEWERFDNRILVAQPAQPASPEDALKLRDHYCRTVRVEDDLALWFHDRCRAVTRRISVNLQAAVREAAIEGAEVIDRAWWGSRPILTGELQTRRTPVGVGR